VGRSEKLIHNQCMKKMNEGAGLDSIQKFLHGSTEHASDFK